MKLELTTAAMLWKSKTLQHLSRTAALPYLFGIIEERWIKLKHSQRRYKGSQRRCNMLSTQQQGHICVGISSEKDRPVRK
jgi:hypothetical protein